MRQPILAESRVNKGIPEDSEESNRFKLGNSNRISVSIYEMIS